MSLPTVDAKPAAGAGAAGAAAAAAHKRGKRLSDKEKKGSGKGKGKATGGDAESSTASAGEGVQHATVATLVASKKPGKSGVPGGFAAALSCFRVKFLHDSIPFPPSLLPCKHCDSVRVPVVSLP